MAFIGTPLDTRNTFQSLVGKRFNGDGSTTAFTLDVAPSSTLDIEVFVGNVRQDPNSAYTLSGTTLTFTGAPPSGTNNIYVVHQAKSVGTIDVPDSSVNSDKLTGNLVTPGTLDVNGQELILDADADTSITADTDDQIDVKIAGADDFKFTANNFNILSGSTLTVDSGATITNSGTATGFGDLVKVAGVDQTSDASGVELQSCFNTTFDSYMMVVRRFIPATNNQNLQMQIMTGTNTVVSATNYFYAFRYYEDTGSVGGPRDDDGTFFQLGSSVTNTEQDGGFSGMYLITVDKTDTSGNSFKITGHGAVRNVNGDLTAFFGGGMYNDTTNDVNPTGLKFTAGSGNVSKIQVTVYGIKE